VALGILKWPWASWSGPGHPQVALGTLKWPWASWSGPGHP